MSGSCLEPSVVETLFLALAAVTYIVLFGIGAIWLVVKTIFSP